MGSGPLIAKYPINGVENSLTIDLALKTTPTELLGIKFGKIGTKIRI